MYPWLTRLARVLARLLGASVATAGVVLGVWFAASALSSPAASAQVLPPPGGSSSSTAASHSSSPHSPSSTKSSAKSSTPSSTPGTVREAQAREAMDNEMYGHTPTKKSATKNAPAKKTPTKTTPAKNPTPSSTPGTVREDQARQAQDDEADRAQKAAAAKKATAQKAELKSVEARQAQDDEADQAQKAAAAKAAAKSPVWKAPHVQVGSPPWLLEVLHPRPTAADRAAAQKAAATQKAEVKNAEAREAMDDEADQAQKTAAAKAAATKAALWEVRHPYQMALWASEPAWLVDPHDRGRADTPVAQHGWVRGNGLGNGDGDNFPTTYMYRQELNQVCNPGGAQGGSPMYEESCGSLFLRHNSSGADGELEPTGKTESYVRKIYKYYESIDGANQWVEVDKAVSERIGEMLHGAGGAAGDEG